MKFLGQTSVHHTIGEVSLITDIHRADLEDQHAISDEISQALTQGPTSTAVDEDELEEELSALQQEDLDEKMLKTGTVPVADQVHGLPNAVRGECESFAALFFPMFATYQAALSLLVLDPCCSRHQTLMFLTVPSSSRNKQSAIEDEEEAELERLKAEMAI